jgi:hypothetical protein
MNDYQESVDKMILNILSFFADNAELTKTNAVLKKHVDILQLYQAELMKNWMVQGANKKGLYVNKMDLKSEIAELIFMLSAALRSYGFDTTDYVMLTNVSKSITKIKRLRDSDVVTYSSIVIEFLQKHEKDIVKYGITTADIEELKEKARRYKSIYLLPAEARGDIAIATSNIKKIITKILLLLKHSIDNDMRYYADVNPDLYKLYFVIRRITKNKTVSLSLKGNVTDAETGEPLQHVVVTVKQEINNKSHEHKKTTTAKGNYQFKHLHDGVCTVSFENYYYNTITIQSSVHHQEFTRLDVEISKE